MWGEKAAGGQLQRGKVSWARGRVMNQCETFFWGLRQLVGEDGEVRLFCFGDPAFILTTTGISKAGRLLSLPWKSESKLERACVKKKRMF